MTDIIQLVSGWTLSYWYPFTRWVWDTLFAYLNLPKLPIVLKDSLTALVFFLPLGITAIIQLRRGRALSDNQSQVHRLLGGVFGIFFLLLICKDVVTIIAEAFYSSDIIGGIIDKIVLSSFYLFVNDYFNYIIICYIFLSLIMSFLWLKKSKEKREIILNHVRKRIKGVAILNGVIAIVIPVSALFSEVSSVSEWPFIASLSILFLILFLMTMAIVYTPKKLFLTTGAAIAFVMAALLFEIITSLIVFIESVSA